MKTTVHNLGTLMSFIYKRATFLLWALALVLVVLYLYFVNSSVFGIMAHEKTKEEADDLRSAIASLEAEYLVLSDRVNLAEAKNQGFEEVAQNDIVAVTVSSTGNLSFLGDEN